VDYYSTGDAVIDLTLGWIELVSFVLALVGWVILTVGLRLIAQIIDQHSMQFKALAQVFNALFLMCGSFIFTRAFSQVLPSYIQVIRIFTLLPVFWVSFEVVRFLVNWYRVKRVALDPSGLRQLQ
jgi:uncharacterized membrane protein